jgi:hypothetical protein
MQRTERSAAQPHRPFQHRIEDWYEVNGRGIERVAATA